MGLGCPLPLKITYHRKGIRSSRHVLRVYSLGSFLLLDFAVKAVGSGPGDLPLSPTGPWGEQPGAPGTQADAHSPPLAGEKAELWSQAHPAPVCVGRPQGLRDGTGSGDTSLPRGTGLSGARGLRGVRSAERPGQVRLRVAAEPEPAGARPLLPGAAPCVFQQMVVFIDLLLYWAGLSFSKTDGMRWHETQG